ncbi:MAG: hypothetical protein AB2693_31865 [Candidatus Thiodiazotropha sp.]
MRTTSSVTSKDKEEEEHDESGVSHSPGNTGSSAVSDDSASSQNGVIYGSFDEKFGETEEKILQTIRCSFPRPLMMKMQRLFLFIVSFGSDIINFTPKGNVVIRGQLLDSNSNILDLLLGSVTDQLTEVPTGLKAFMQALRDINVPSNFLHSGHTVRKWRNEKDHKGSGRWRPY